MTMDEGGNYYDQRINPQIIYFKSTELGWQGLGSLISSDCEI